MMEELIVKYFEKCDVCSEEEEEEAEEEEE
jgi:hypothetical protein